MDAIWFHRNFNEYKEHKTLLEWWNTGLYQSNILQPYSPDRLDLYGVGSYGNEEVLLSDQNSTTLTSSYDAV